MKARRTIGYSANHLVGEQEWLEAFLNAAVECRLIGIDEKGGTRSFQFTNTCSFPFLLRRGKAVHTLRPFQSLRIKISRNEDTGEWYEPLFQVDNMWTAGDKQPKVTIEIDK